MGMPPPLSRGRVQQGISFFKMTEKLSRVKTKAKGFKGETAVSPAATYLVKNQKRHKMAKPQLNSAKLKEQVRSLYR